MVENYAHFLKYSYLYIVSLIFLYMSLKITDWAVEDRQSLP